MNRSKLTRACRSLLWITFLLAESQRCFAQDAANMIFDMENLRFKAGEFADDKGAKHSAGLVEPVVGKVGQAAKFDFVKGASGGFMMAPIAATPDWDSADGFSFWVKGDGSQSWGGIELIDRSDFGLRYGYCFPINSTDWRKITVPWRDVIPELAGPPVDVKTGYKPSGFGNFWFGKWYYWRDYPAESFSIDQIALEPHIAASGAKDTAADSKDAKPAPIKPGLTRLLAKLGEHKPITIVTMGDSLTDEHHWANKEVVWSRLLAKAIEEKHGSKVTIVNPAIGGTTLSQNMILMPRWSIEAPTPDLVTVWFGYNDWDTGVRGPRFAEYLRLAVDRIRRQTHGSADILLMTSNASHARWDTMAELEQAVRDVAKEKQTGLADIAAEFRKPGTPDESLKQDYWAWDKGHLGKHGHQVVADAVLKAIEAAK
jgi:lysophospholipase L1-like esterase